MAAVDTQYVRRHGDWFCVGKVERYDVGFDDIYARVVSVLALRLCCIIMGDLQGARSKGTARERHATKGLLIMI